MTTENSTVFHQHITTISSVRSSVQRTLVDPFAIQPQNIIERRHGILIGFFRVHDTSMDYVANFLTAVLKKEFYISTARSTEAALEAALSKVNIALTELARNGTVLGPDKLDGAVCAFTEQSVCFSTCGQGRISLFRDHTLQHISASTPSDTTLATFHDIACGECRNGDTFLIVSRDAADILSPDICEQGCRRYHGDARTQFFRTALVNQTDGSCMQLVDIVARRAEIYRRDHDLDISDDTVTLPDNVFSAQAFERPESSVPTTPSDSSSSEESPSPAPVGHRTHIYVHGEAEDVARTPLHEVLHEQTFSLRQRYRALRHTVHTSLQSLYATLRHATDITHRALNKAQHTIRTRFHQTAHTVSAHSKTHIAQWKDAVAQWQERRRESAELRRVAAKTQQANIKQDTTADVSLKSSISSEHPEALSTTITEALPDDGSEREEKKEQEVSDTIPRATDVPPEAVPQSQRTAVEQRVVEDHIRQHNPLTAGTALENFLARTAPHHDESVPRVRRTQRRLRAVHATRALVRAVQSHAHRHRKHLRTAVNAVRHHARTSWRQLPVRTWSWHDCQTRARAIGCRLRHLGTRLLPHPRRLLAHARALSPSQRGIAALVVGAIIVVPFLLHRMQVQDATQDFVPESTSEHTPATPSEETPRDLGSAVIHRTYVVHTDPSIHSLLSVRGKTFVVAPRSITAITNATTKKTYTLPHSFDDTVEAVAMDALNMIILRTQKNTFVAFAPAAQKKFTPLHVILPPGVDIERIATYLTYLYIFDATNNDIYRHARTPDGFGAPVDWLRDGTDFGAPRDTIIDGTIYMATDTGDIVTFFKNKKQSTLTANLSPPLHADALFTANADAPLFILDRAVRRIIALTKDTATVTLNITNDAFNTVRSFTVDERLSTITALHEDGTVATYRY